LKEQVLISGCGLSLGKIEETNDATKYDIAANNTAIFMPKNNTTGLIAANPSINDITQVTLKSELAAERFFVDAVFGIIANSAGANITIRDAIKKLYR
jgi:hypothetical protein